MERREHLIVRLWKWFFSNAAWEIFRKYIPLLFISSISTYIAYLKQTIPIYLDSMGIPSVLSFLIIFFGSLTAITTILVPTYNLINYKLSHQIKRYKWDSLLISEYVFPSESPFGIGLKIENLSGNIVEGLSAELDYLINTKTKDRPIILEGKSFLPWTRGISAYQYDAQNIQKGSPEFLVLICWNKAKREVWFPTSSVEEAKEAHSFIVDAGFNRVRIRTRPIGTMLYGNSFYFEITIRNYKGNINYSTYFYRRNIYIDGDWNVRYV